MPEEEFGAYDNFTEHAANCYQSCGISEEGSHQLASGERPSDRIDQAMMGSWDAQQPIVEPPDWVKDIDRMDAINRSKEIVDEAAQGQIAENKARWNAIARSLNSIDAVAGEINQSPVRPERVRKPNW